MKLPDFDDVRAAAARIGPYVHRTPIFTSQHIDDLTGACVFFKAENLQKVGAFKARGAMNAIMALSPDEASRGVITHSSGNHGQAVAFAAKSRGIPATVVMPHHAPGVKVAAVEGYGAQIVFCDQPRREEVLAEEAERTGAVQVHPFDDPGVIAGQATATLELVEQVPDLDVILAPIGGGGLLSGASIVGTIHGLEVVGAEPEVVDDAFRSLRDGVQYPATGEISVGDGLLTGIGTLAFAILARDEREILVVTDDEMLAAMRLVAERMKLVIEPSSATVVAALARYSDAFRGRRVGAILSGGNVDLSMLATSGDR